MQVTTELKLKLPAKRPGFRVKIRSVKDIRDVKSQRLEKTDEKTG